MQAVRLRRLRKNKNIRDLVAQTEIGINDFILPYFAVRGRGIKKEIKALPGVRHLSIDNLIKDVDEAVKLGIKAVLLFGIQRDVTPEAVKALKKEFPDLAVITDVCLCGYSEHGHCGIIRPKTKDRRQKTKIIDNDLTLEELAKLALSHAEAGADLVAPSAMMDHQVEAIREELDKNNLVDTGILSYSAKYASGFYGPFREVFDSAPKFGDRKTYQMDFRNRDEALREIELDINEGSDIVMIKPALAYLDIIYRAREKFNIPIAAYNVSGEYAMVKAYADKPEIEKNLALEILTAIKRAGADLIISYWAKDAAKWLN